MKPYLFVELGFLASPAPQSAAARQKLSNHHRAWMSRYFDFTAVKEPPLPPAVIGP
jgi:hypothetical protein